MWVCVGGLESGKNIGLYGDWGMGNGDLGFPGKERKRRKEVGARGSGGQRGERRKSTQYMVIIMNRYEHVSVSVLVSVCREIEKPIRTCEPCQCQCQCQCRKVCGRWR